MSAESIVVGSIQRNIAARLKQQRLGSFAAILRDPRNAPRIERTFLFAILGITAILYAWNLDKNGWANPYYSAAAQAGAADWKAWFFGSADAGNLVTIDKTPLSVWVMGLSVRIFGLSSWSILLPQVCMGIATTWLIYKIIRTNHSAAPALFGAAVYASTPVVVLMSRFNNPEPLMGLLVVASVYCTVKAIGNGRWRWFLFAGALLGFAVMAKQVQALLVVPSLIIGVAVTGSGSLKRRAARLAGALGMLLVTGGWWMVAVELTPASQRPYVGGSAGNSALQLTTGYNGLARFAQFTNQDGVAVPSESASLFGTFKAGLARLFSADFAPEAAWLLFPSLACAVVILVLKGTSGPQRYSPTALIASTWLLTVVAVLTMAGTMVHSYYTFSFAAPMAVVLPLGLLQLWNARGRPVSRLMGSVVIGATGYLASRILEYSHSWPPGWQLAVPATAVVAGVLWWLPINRKIAILLPVAASLLIGPAMTNLYTINTPQGGTNPLSGPSSAVEGSLSKRFEAALRGEDLRSLHLAFGAPPSPELVQRLGGIDGPTVTWAAMTVTAQNAALYQLESRRPVAALGGWLGLDPAPTLDQFKKLAAEGRIGLFIDQPELLREQAMGSETEKIVEWIRAHFVAVEVGEQVVYDMRSIPLP